MADSRYPYKPFAVEFGIYSKPPINSTALAIYIGKLLNIQSYMSCLLLKMAKNLDENLL